MTEYFDVVTFDDEVTGQLTTKVEAHAGHIIHRCVAVYVFNNEGKLYVQHHKASGMLDHTVGGHVSAGESYELAAKREAEEEISLYGQELEVIAEGVPSDELFNPSKQTTKQFHMFGIFECRPSSNWKFVPNDEVEELSLFSLEEVVDGMHKNPTNYTPGFIITMAKYLELKRPDINFDLDHCRNNWGEI